MLENSTVNINALCNSCEDSIQHISIRVFGVCEDVQHFSQHSYNATINRHYGQLTLHNTGSQILTTVQ
jgi:hypothetical protein